MHSHSKMYFFTLISIEMNKMKPLRKHIKIKLLGNLIPNQWSAKQPSITF